MLVMEYDLTKISPASYNPRYLSADKRALLLESLAACGVLKPIIVNSNGTIMAGHQRTKCMLELGITKAPAYIIDGIGVTDEVRFNQLHNAADKEMTGEGVTRISGAPFGWSEVQPDQVTIFDRGGRNAPMKKELAKMLLRYGTFGCCVTDQDGNVIVSSEYAQTCKVVGKPLLVYRAAAELVPNIRKYFAYEYGVFSYDHLEKRTYIQTLAQMNRLVEGKAQMESLLYRGFAIPNMAKTTRLLDFGAGKMAYVRKLQGAGYRGVLGLEFYFRAKGANAIDVAKVNRDISAVAADLKANGRFDMVLCDSVLNSVDSLKAERCVLNTLRAMCKPGGDIFFSGRSREFVERIAATSESSGSQNYLYFIDENGFTANLRSGNWFYQKFHTNAQVRALAESFGRVVKIDGGGTSKSSWRVWVKNDNPLSPEEVREAIEFEFTLPLPTGSYKRAGDVLEALNAAD